MAWANQQFWATIDGLFAGCRWRRGHGTRNWQRWLSQIAFMLVWHCRTETDVRIGSIHWNDGNGQVSGSRRTNNKDRPRLCFAAWGRLLWWALILSLDVANSLLLVFKRCLYIYTLNKTTLHLVTRNTFLHFDSGDVLQFIPRPRLCSYLWLTEFTI